MVVVYAHSPSPPPFDTPLHNSSTLIRFIAHMQVVIVFQSSDDTPLYCPLAPKMNVYIYSSYIYYIYKISTEETDIE